MNEQDNYTRLYSMGNLTLAWRKAREHKTKKSDIVKFEKNLEKNLLELHYELKYKAYKPRKLETFTLRDPKTRKISKSDFRDRVVHHALILIIGKLFEKQFIYDSCANQINKGALFSLKRFDKFQRKVTNNYSVDAYCLKADVKHYFHEVNHEILNEIISKNIKNKDVMWLVRKILNNVAALQEGGGANAKNYYFLKVCLLVI